MASARGVVATAAGVVTFAPSSLKSAPAMTFAVARIDSGTEPTANALRRIAQVSTATLHNPLHHRGRRGALRSGLLAGFSSALARISGIAAESIDRPTVSKSPAGMFRAVALPGTVAA